MRKIVLALIIAFVFSTSAMAGDIAISTHGGWMSQGHADNESQEIADNVTGAAVELFAQDQQDALADWVVAHTGNGQADLLILMGRLPASIYPAGNAQPDGSIAELFLDDGNIIINTGDYCFYVTSAGSNNGDSGLKNMTDTDADMWGDPGTDMIPTVEGHAVAPSFQGANINRPWILSQLEGTDWQPELIIGQSADGAQADPAIMVNTVTGGRVGTFFQRSNDSLPRGEVISEWINSYYLTDGAIPNAPAWNPVPADGAIDADVASLEWAAAFGAVSYKVYLSTDATIDDADLLGETGLTLQVAIMDPGTTYYWRVDAVDADGVAVEGPVWSFSTLPLEAHFPSPADGGTNFLGTTLSWTPGKNAIMHNVHFGTDPAALVPVSMMQMDTTYDAGALDPGTTYYWRVDEFTPAGTVTGPVWSFTTVGEIGPSDIPDLIARYEFEEDASTLAVLDTSGNGNHGALLADAAVSGGVLNLDGSGDYVNVPLDVPETGTAISLWFKTANPNCGVYAVVDAPLGDGGHDRHIHLTGGNIRIRIWDTEVLVTSGLNVADDAWHHLVHTYGDDIGGQRLYVDGDLRASGTKAASNFDWQKNVNIGFSNDAAQNFFEGALDDVRLYNRTLTQEEVRVMAGVEDLPYSPAPADGEGDVDARPTLGWNPALDAVEQDVYLGTDAAAVATADATDTTGIYVGRQAETELALADLSRGVTYFWKVDGVKADGTVMPGPVWSFRVVDRNTDNWASALANTTAPDYLATYLQNGAYDIGALGGEITYEFIVNANPDEAEVSMALIGRIGHGDTTAALKYEQYNNTGNYGATIFGVMDYDYGVANSLGEYTHLVFVSSETAATTELYVNGDLAGSVPAAITLSGIVGIGQAIRDPEGAAFIDPFDGTIFGVAIYDRLLTADEIAANSDKYFNPIPITDPDLVAYYDFESGEGSIALDQSGHSNHGTLEDGPTFVSGKFGQALAFDGSRVTIPASSSLTADMFQGSFTLSGWINPTRTGNTWQQIFRAMKPDDSSNDTLFLNNDGRLSWRGRVNGGWAGGMCETAPDVVPAGQWTHFAVTGDGTNFRVYVNGIVSQESAFQITDGTNATYYIGGNTGAAGESYAGMVDDLRVYSKTLTEVDILRLGQPDLGDVTAPGDTIQGVPNDGDWPSNEHPALVIDNDSGTKYLHRKGGSMATGFQVEPAMGATIVTALTLTTANDDYGRDPITFELSGSNESIDGPYELIAAGDVVDFAQVDLWPRFTMNATAITFDNAVAYKYYQVVFPSLRDPASALMQIADVELLGVPAPVYFEDFESYAAGTDLQGVGGWAGWAGDAAASAPVSNEHASSGSNAVEVIGSADLVQEFDVAGGTWIFSAMQYIHSGTAGTSYFILMNQYGAANDWSVQTTFNLETGAIGFWHGGSATIVYDQWVEVKYVIDLDNNTVDKYYNGAYVVTDTWDDNAHGTLAAIDLYGNGASSVFYDDITLVKQVK